MTGLYKLLNSVFEETDLVDYEMLKAMVVKRASELGDSSVTKIISAHEAQAKREENRSLKASNEFDRLEKVYVTSNSRGVADSTIENYLRVMRFDKHYNGVKYNLLLNSAEIHQITVGNQLTIRRWTDSDNADSLRYCETEYGLYSEGKHDSAFRIFLKENEYNPITDIINGLKWDGENRCEHFLTKWANADDTPYVREVSRLIFAGAIWRAYLPGCKYDDVPVLIGAQGSGKSSLVRFLAINDSFFSEIKEIEGAQSIEQLDGAWICEIPELAATTKAKEVEAVKAYITRQRDKYRKPYDRNVTELPRRCIFIGTTNNPTFLTDLTGNRRYYPVQTNCNGYDIFNHEQEIRDYIIQCWAEAYDRYKKGAMPNYASRELVSDYREAQDAATQDDWRVGAIESYLNEKPVGAFVCVKEIMTYVISQSASAPRDPTPKDSKEISIIISKTPGWKRAEQRVSTETWGRQRGYVKAFETNVKERKEELPF